MTGRKAEQKVYRHHTQFVGGLKEIPFERMMERAPERVRPIAPRQVNKLRALTLTPRVLASVCSVAPGAALGRERHAAQEQPATSAPAQAARLPRRGAPLRGQRGVRAPGRRHQGHPHHHAHRCRGERGIRRTCHKQSSEARMMRPSDTQSRPPCIRAPRMRTWAMAVALHPVQSPFHPSIMDSLATIVPVAPSAPHPTSRQEQQRGKRWSSRGRDSPATRRAARGPKTAAMFWRTFITVAPWRLRCTDCWLTRRCGSSPTRSNKRACTSSFPRFPFMFHLLVSYEKRAPFRRWIDANPTRIARDLWLSATGTGSAALCGPACAVPPLRRQRVSSSWSCLSSSLCSRSSLGIRTLEQRESDAIRVECRWNEGNEGGLVHFLVLVVVRVLTPVLTPCPRPFLIRLPSCAYLIRLPLPRSRIPF